MGIELTANQCQSVEQCHVLITSLYTRELILSDPPYPSCTVWPSRARGFGQALVRFGGHKLSGIAIMNPRSLLWKVYLIISCKYIYIPCASKHDKNVGFIPKHEVLGGNTRFPILVFFSAHAIFEGRATGT